MAPPPCDEPICKSKSDAMRKMFGAVPPNNKSGSAKNNNPSSSQQPQQQQHATGAGGSGSTPCPPDREELGTHSWTLLHTMAAYFPNVPTSSQSAAAINLIRAIGELYPCRHCAADFREHLEESPPKVGSRAELSVWMCEAHNRVNRLLGKDVFSCALGDLDRRWRKGDAHCDEPSGSLAEQEEQAAE